MTIGIYALRFIGTDKVYIGQSINIESRFDTHLNSFKNKNISRKLNKAFEDFGKPILEILQECNTEELNKLENYYIHLYKATEVGFNTLEHAEDIPRLYGEKHSQSKYSNEKIIKVFNLLVLCPHMVFKDISLITGVSYSSIACIATSYSHLWLKDKFPEEYKILESLKGKRFKTKCAKDLGKVYLPILSPNNVVYSNIENISAFAREHSLDNSTLSKLLRGKIKQYKGWKLA